MDIFCKLMVGMQGLGEVNVISSSTTCSWINIFVDPGTTFQSTNQI